MLEHAGARVPDRHPVERRLPAQLAGNLGDIDGTHPGLIAREGPKRRGELLVIVYYVTPLVSPDVPLPTVIFLSSASRAGAWWA